MSEEPDDHQTDEPTDREEESGHTGHDKYRPVNLAGDRSDALMSRRKRRSKAGRDESESDREGGMRRYGTGETERTARRYGREHRETRPGAPRSRDDARASASEHHRSGRGGRPSDRRHYDSRSVQQGRSSGSPRTGSQRGSHREEGLGGRLGGHYGGRSRRGSDDQESLGDQYRYGGERGGSNRDRRYGSRRGNSTRRDPRRR